MSAAVVQARGLSREFGGLRAVQDVDLDLRGGQVLGVIGPNGAGKSTLINLLTGQLRPSRGSVVYLGRDITGHKPWRVARAGVARTFQIVKPFRGMTVLDNVMVPTLAGIARVEGRSRSLRGVRQAAMETLDRVGLADRAQAAPSELSVGDARRLELARALAIRPQVLLLDEVLAGLRPIEIRPALDLIDSLRGQGLAILMVEHIVQAIAAISDEVMVLHHGEVLSLGQPSRVLSDPRVVEAYLGSRYAQQVPTDRGVIEAYIPAEGGDR